MDSMLEQEYEDRNGCAYTEEETVSPNGSEEVRCPVCGDRECDGECDHGPEQEGDESMDGDHGSALSSAGLGTDEDYEHNLFDESEF